MKKILLFLAPILVFIETGCKKSYLETVPSNAVTTQQIFSQLNTTYAAMNGVFKEQFAYGTGGNSRHDAFGQKALDLQNDLMGNDMVVNSQGYGWFNSDYNLTEWGLATQNRSSDYAWYYYYDIIKQANSIINNVDGLTDATQAQKDVAKGQGYALRAYAYFYLINYFQQTYKGNENKPGVPIYTSVTNVGKGRGAVKDVYAQIISDLGVAETLLTGKPRDSKTNIDVSVVQGFRARTALIMEDWATASSYAAKAYAGYTLFQGAQYLDLGAFSTIGAAEWMWGANIPASQATIYPSFFSHMDIRTGGYAALGGQKKITKALYDQIPTSDIRQKAWKTPGTGAGINPDYNQLKFQVPDVTNRWQADYVFMRVAEMYLIQAEALERQGLDDQARVALETLIKTRNPLYSAAGLTGTNLLNEILLQRRIELWGEGFALMDIKRLNQGLNRPTGPGNHGAPNFDPGVYTTSPADARFIMRIPQRELDNNSAMTPADQNP